MPIANIRRPQIIQRLNLENVAFWNKRTSDNIDLINGKLEYVEIDVTHDTETLFDNPRKEDMPIGFVPIAAVLIDSSGSETASLNLASWQLGVLRTDGQIGLTTSFQGPVGSVVVRRTIDQTLNNNTNTPIAFDSQEVAPSGDLSHDTVTDNTKITCASDGYVQAHFDLRWADLAVVLGNRIGGFIGRNGTTLRYGPVRVHSSGSRDCITGGDIIPVEAGDVLTLQAIQANSVAGTRAVAGGVSSGGDAVRLDLRYVGPPDDYAATVRGFLVYA